jgi:hypothetical protein
LAEEIKLAHRWSSGQAVAFGECGQGSIPGESCEEIIRFSSTDFSKCVTCGARARDGTTGDQALYQLRQKYSWLKAKKFRLQQTVQNLRSFSLTVKTKCSYYRGRTVLAQRSERLYLIGEFRV